MWGSTQLRVRTRFGLSGRFRYANMKSVPGLVTMISSPSNLTSRSMIYRSTRCAPGDAAGLTARKALANEPDDSCRQGFRR